jgi:hypothetical protein
VLDELQLFVHETPHANDVGSFDGDDDEDEDEEEEDEGVEGLVFMDPFEWDLVMSNNGLETDPNHAQHGFPRIATTRHNLTALSQQYNVRAPSGDPRASCVC